MLPFAFMFFIFEEEELKKFKNKKRNSQIIANIIGEGKNKR